MLAVSKLTLTVFDNEIQFPINNIYFKCVIHLKIVNYTNVPFFKISGNFDTLKKFKTSHTQTWINKFFMDKITCLTCEKYVRSFVLVTRRGIFEQSYNFIFPIFWSIWWFMSRIDFTATVNHKISEIPLNHFTSGTLWEIKTRNVNVSVTFTIDLFTSFMIAKVK